jgi:ribosome-associated heat shock protein Hsp15
VARHRNDRTSTDGVPGETAGNPAPGGLRIDKWLWCTRFFKTRGLAQAAVEGGHVQLGGERIKASRQVKVGDRLSIVRAQERYIVDVLSIPERRGPAPEARRHYRETPESEAARAHVRELNRLSGPVSEGRPDKRERRDLLRFVKGRGAVSDDGDAH